MPPFAIDDYLARVRAFDGPRFTVATLATVNEYPMLAVHSKAAADKTLLVLAGVHGDEVGGILAVPSILEAYPPKRVRLVLVTPVNPIGAARGKRSNGQGRDINRDFVRFATAEARAVQKVFGDVRPDFVVSLHEGPQHGAFMFTNQHVAAPLATALCDALAAGGTKLATRDYFGRRLRPPGWAPATSTTRAVWKLGAALGKKATITYSEDRGVPEIVLEGSTRVKDEAERVRPHVDLIAALACTLGE